MDSFHAARARHDFPPKFRGTTLGHLTRMVDIRELVEALPECEKKGALRGLATAARVVDERSRAEILQRMAVLVRRWHESDPLHTLSAELGRQLRANSSHEPPDGGDPHAGCGSGQEDQSLRSTSAGSTRPAHRAGR